MLFIHSFVNGHLGCVYLWATVNHAAMTMGLLPNGFLTIFDSASVLILGR